MGIKREVKADPGDVPKAKKVKKAKAEVNKMVEKKTENKVKKVAPQQKQQKEKKGKDERGKNKKKGKEEKDAAKEHHDISEMKKGKGKKAALEKKITEKKAGLDKLEFLKKSKKGDGGDSKGDPKGESAEDAEEAKNRRAQFKELKEIRQQKQRGEDVYTLGTEAKRLWEKVRREDCPESERRTLVTKLHGNVKGSVGKLIYAHDTVRVIECLMAIGAEDIRDALFAELRDEVVPMAKSKYASFFVGKMIKYGSKAQKEQIFKTFDGKVAELMKHKIANAVVESFYNDVANAAQRNSMLQEFCGPEFRHFKETSLRTVAQLIEKFPEKKKDIVRHLGDNVSTLINKGCYNHSLVHTVIYNYIQVCSPKSRTDLIEQLREVCVHVLHSHDGARLSALAVFHGTPKDRKAKVKSFKTFVPKICGEQFGHMVLMSVFSAVDDTKLVSKAIIGEMAEAMADITSTQYGRKVLMHLMAPRDTKYFHPDEIAMIKQGDDNEHSKKDPELRAKELREAVSAPLAKYFVEHLSDLIKDSKSTIFTTCVLNSLDSKAAKPVLELLAEEAARPFEAGEMDGNLVESPAGHMMLKKVIAHDAKREQDCRFSGFLLSSLDDVSLECWISTNRGAFLLADMISDNDPESLKAVKDKVGAVRKTLALKKTKGAELLRKKLGW